MSDEIVDCGRCSACCYQLVVLTPEEGEGLFYQHVDDNDGTRVLRRRTDGSCVHLVEGRCSVWERRPIVCRTFHCGKWYATFMRRYPELIRNTERFGTEHDQQMVREGRARAAGF